MFSVKTFSGKTFCVLMFEYTLYGALKYIFRCLTWTKKREYKLKTCTSKGQRNSKPF